MASSAAIPIINPTAEAIKIKVKTGSLDLTEALEAARKRYVERNPQSLKLFEEAVKCLPGGNTRHVLFTAPFPVYLQRGEGHQVFSEDGQVFTDFIGELTAGLYGHSNPLIREALTTTIQHTGLNLGGTTKHEARHASLLCERFNLDLVRFTNSGTEANLHALQAAKRFTGKQKVVVFNGAYHGACFEFPTDKPAVNVVDKQDFIVAEYNNVQDAKTKIEESENVAAVLVEGMQGRGPCLPATREFLHQVQDSARKVGAVFMLDEVMTSRLAPGGLQELEGLKPDITTLGKYLGGGITFGAFGGREEIMQVYDPRNAATGLSHSGTFNNNTLGMVTGYTGLSKIYTPEVAWQFNAMGDRFREKLQNISHGTKLTVTGRGSLVGIHFLRDGRKELQNIKQREPENDLSDLFWLEMMEDGFWTHKRGNFSLMLGTPESELDRFVDCMKEFLRRHEDLVRI